MLSETTNTRHFLTLTSSPALVGEGWHKTCGIEWTMLKTTYGHGGEGLRRKDGDNNIEPKLIMPGKLGLKSMYLPPSCVHWLFQESCACRCWHPHCTSTAHLQAASPSCPCAHTFKPSSQGIEHLEMCCAALIFLSGTPLDLWWENLSMRAANRHNLNKQLDTDCTELQSRKSCFFKLCYKPFLSIGTDSPKINNYNQKAHKSRAKSQGHPY